MIEFEDVRLALIVTQCGEMWGAVASVTALKKEGTDLKDALELMHNGRTEDLGEFESVSSALAIGDEYAKKWVASQRNRS